MDTMKPSDWRLLIIGLVFIIFVGTLVWMGPIPQDLEYHNFADVNSFFSIPNFWNVISNLPFFFLGIYGLSITFRNWSVKYDFTSKWIPLMLSLGIFLACFGSAYYHWIPNNRTLVWDRLPMTFMFMPLFALLIYDFIGKKTGAMAFLLLLPLGVISVFYWQYTETLGQGDLRIYAFVQFFPMLVAPFILWLYPKKVAYIKYILFLLGWYVLAKICEHYDDAIFDILGFWSGHTIKHLLGGVSLYYALKLIVSWEKVLLEK